MLRRKVGDEVWQCLERKRESRLVQQDTGREMWRIEGRKEVFVSPQKKEDGAVPNGGGADFRWRIKGGESSVDK